MELTMDEAMPRARLALLLEHFSELGDDREAWRVAYPIREVLLLVTCATVASCDDFEDIVAWGEQNLDFLRRFCEFHHGVPCARWLRDLVNRVDPVLFRRCFDGWVAALWPDRHDIIAIDGKTARRTHDRGKGLKALHTLSAYATKARLTLAQLSVPEKSNEITAIPDLIDDLAAAGQLSSKSMKNGPPQPAPTSTGNTKMTETDQTQSPDNRLLNPFSHAKTPLRSWNGMPRDGRSKSSTKS